MSYSIYIGNAVPEFTKDDGYLEARWVVEGATHDDAPTFPNDAMTANTNGRHPSYSGWAEFCELTGLTALFFDKYDGLMRDHPGCQLLSENHWEAIKIALDNWIASSIKLPGFGREEVRDGRLQTLDTDKYDPILARLLWLEWWVRWALDHCETPAIYNH